VDEVIVRVYRQDLAAKVEVQVRPLLPQIVPISVGLYTGPFLAAKQIQPLRSEVETVRAAGYKECVLKPLFWLFKGSSDLQS